MAGEAPAGVRAHGRRGKRIESKLGSAGVDVFGSGLQSLEVLDVGDIIAGLGEQFLVDDAAVALVAVADGAELTILVIEVVSVGGQLVGDGRAGQIVAVVAPCGDSSLVADDEQRGHLALVHLSGQRLVVRAGSGGHDRDGNTGLLGVHGSDLLERFVRLRFEVQPVDGTGSCGSSLFGGFLGGSRFFGLGLLGGSGRLGRLRGRLGVGGRCASHQTKRQNQRQEQCDKLFHYKFLLLNFT